jgi:GNAT acetyltransferase
MEALQWITPELYLKTSFVLDDKGRIVSTREPNATGGPLFTVIRSPRECAWAVRADIPRDLADELDRLAQTEPAAVELRHAPVHAERYIALLGDLIPPEIVAATKTSESDGPAFAFPEAFESADFSGSESVVLIEDERLLKRNFRGWLPGEIAAGSGPVLAIVEDGSPVSICFCARRSNSAAEAGVETAEAYRGRGYASRVVTAWAVAVRASGRIPLYSTSWSNTASLGVAAKLKLMPYASSWSAV